MGRPCALEATVCGHPERLRSGDKLALLQRQDGLRLQMAIERKESAGLRIRAVCEENTSSPFPFRHGHVHAMDNSRQDGTYSRARRNKDVDAEMERRRLRFD